MAKIDDWTSGEGGTSGSVIKTRIREGIKAVETDGTYVTGDGNVGSEVDFTAASKAAIAQVTTNQNNISTLSAGLGLFTPVSRTYTTGIKFDTYGANYNEAAPSSLSSITLDYNDELYGGVASFFSDGTEVTTINAGAKTLITGGTQETGQTGVLFLLNLTDTVIANWVPSASSGVPQLTTPAIALVAGDTEIDYTLSSIDANATGGAFTYDTNSDFSTEQAVPGWSFGTTTGTVTSLSNGTTYYFRFKVTASGYTDSAYGSDSAAPVAFAPSDLTELIAWYDASDAATITDTAGAVTAWTDKEGVFDVAQASAGSQPSTGTNTINSLNALDFDGTDDVMVGSGQILSTNSWHIFAVIKHSQTGVGQAILTQNTGAATTGRAAFLQISTADQASIFINNGTSYTGSGTTTLTDATDNILESVAASNNYSVAVNGEALEQVITGQALTPLNTDFAIGATNGISSIVGDFNGDIGEILVCNAQLSAGDRTNVLNYLSAKWGITI